MAGSYEEMEKKKNMDSLHAKGSEKRPAEANRKDFVSLRGCDIPPAIESFMDMAIEAGLRKNLSKFQMQSPTLVQKYAMPILAANKDLLACAQPGSGKTFSYLLPIVQKIVECKQQPTGSAEQPSLMAVIITPTRELVQILLEDVLKLSAGTGIKPLSVFSDLWRECRERCQKMNCDVLLSTPSCLLDGIQRCLIDLQQVRYLVIDEADDMIWSKSNLTIEKILQQPDLSLKTERCTIIMSATLPGTVKEIAKHYMKEPIILEIGRIGGSVPANVNQTVLWVHQDDKKAKLLSLLLQNQRCNISELTLVFLPTKAEAIQVLAFLKRHNIMASLVYVGKKNSDIEPALESFRQGHHTILLATNVCERTLNVPNVHQVINYDMPSEIGNYVHRVRRTGRMGEEGHAFTFFNSSDGKVRRDLLLLLEEAEQNVPDFLTAAGFQKMHAQYERTENRSNLYKNEKTAKNNEPAQERDGKKKDSQATKSYEIADFAAKNQHDGPYDGKQNRMAGGVGEQKEKGYRFQDSKGRAYGKRY